MPDLIGIGIVVIFLMLLAWVFAPKGKPKPKASSLDLYLVDDIMGQVGAKLSKLSPGGRAELCNRIKNGGK